MADDEDRTDPDITPIRTEACGRCAEMCVVAGPDDFAGGLPDFCARSPSGNWGWCVRAPRKLVYYPDGV